MSPDDGNDDAPWWEHALNALSAGYDLHTQKRQKAAAERAHQLAARRKQRETGSAGSSFGSAGPRKRVKLDPDAPCCTGPRGK